MIEHRLTRYGLAGGLSLLTHLLVLIVLVESAGRSPVLASTLGFIASFLVSFALQHRWVFEHSHPVSHTLPRFLAVTLVGLGLNAAVMTLGHDLLGIHYLVIQAVAFVLIPVSNYLLNRRWTFNTTAATAARPPDVTQPPVPVADRAGLIALTLAFIALGFAAVLHLDLARDLATVYDMRTTGEWISAGPQLAGVFNLGPVWYYLLAVLQSIGLGVAGIALVLTLLASAQFFVTYRAGARWIDGQTGLLWATLLLLPGWHSFEQIFITHPVLTTLLLSTTTLCGLQFVDTGRRRALVLMGLSFSLAMHAHPTSLLVLALPVGLYLQGVNRHGFRLLDPVLAGAAALLPFLPFFIDQLQAGWPMFSGLAEFQSGQAGRVSMDHFLAIGQQLLGGGLHYLLDHILGLPAVISATITLVTVAVMVLGLAGSIGRLLGGDRLTLILWLALISGWLGLMVLRVVHPYYMLTPLSFVLAALVASGLHHWHSAPSRRRLPRPALLVLGPVLLLQLGLAVHASRLQQAGHWPFAFYPFMDIKQDAGSHRDHAFMSALNSRRSARWLCRNPGLSVHGPYALTLIHGYAMEARLNCGALDLHAGGGAPDRPRVVGLPVAMVPADLARPVARVGPFDVFNVVSVPRPQAAVDLSTFRTYPPFVPAFKPERLERIELGASEGRAVAVTHLGFALSRRPTVRLRCGTDAISPTGEDHTTWLFDLTACGQTPVLEIEISDPAHLDVVVF
jgi:putative flippase GtrA